MRSSYQTRDDILLRLGFVSYKEYLNSDLWKLIRARGFKVHGNKCKICGQETNILHHKNYEWEILSGKTVNGLVPLCKTCHYHIEFSGGRKMSLDQANNKLAKYLSRKIKRKNNKTKKKKKKIKELSRKDKLKCLLDDYHNGTEKQQLHILGKLRIDSFIELFHTYPDWIESEIVDDFRAIAFDDDIMVLPDEETQKVYCRSCGNIWETEYRKKYARCPLCYCKAKGMSRRPKTSKKQVKKRMSINKTRIIIQKAEKTLADTKQELRNVPCEKSPLSKFIRTS